MPMTTIRLRREITPPEVGALVGKSLTFILLEGDVTAGLVTGVEKHDGDLLTFFFAHPSQDPFTVGLPALAYQNG